MYIHTVYLPYWLLRHIICVCNKKCPGGGGVGCNCSTLTVSRSPALAASRSLKSTSEFLTGTFSTKHRQKNIGLTFIKFVLNKHEVKASNNWESHFFSSVKKRWRCRERGWHFQDVTAAWDVVLNHSDGTEDFEFTLDTHKHKNTHIRHQTFLRAGIFAWKMLNLKNYTFCEKCSKNFHN